MRTRKCKYYPTWDPRSCPSDLDKIIMLDNVEYPTEKMENRTEWRSYLESKNLNTTLEPDPIQVYKYMGQLKVTHQKFGSGRDRKSKLGHAFRS